MYGISRLGKKKQKKKINGFIRAGGQMDGWTDGWMEGWRDGGMEGWRDGRTDG